MSQRSIQGTSRGSISSDTIVKSSSESEKKPREKYEEKSVDPEKKPRLQSVESSGDSESDEKTEQAEKSAKQGLSLGKKIKNTWKEVKEKLADKSGRALKTKTTPSCKFEADDPFLSEEERTNLWQKNGRNLFSNLAVLKTDFEKSQRAVTNLIANGDINSAASAFNAADYAGLSFDFSSTMSGGALINPMKIFGSKSVVTSTQTKRQEFLADFEDESIRQSYALSKPIKLCASRIGPVLFTNQLLNILREIPLTCPVMLDASSNNLGPAELSELVRFMEEHPVIYYLDLGNNPICPDEKASLALMQLFKVLGPVSRLFLDNTGFNDSTAEFIDFSVRDNTCLRHLDLRGNKLTERGISLMIYSAVPSDFYLRKNNDNALSMIQLQNNVPDEWYLITAALNVAFDFSQIAEENFVPTPPAIPVQIDIPYLHVQALKFPEPYLSEIIKPESNSADGRL